MHVLDTCAYTPLYILEIIKARQLCVFYEHVDTRISSLSYKTLKRFDNDFQTKTHFKNLYKLWN